MEKISIQETLSNTTAWFCDFYHDGINYNDHVLFVK